MSRPWTPGPWMIDDLESVGHSLTSTTGKDGMSVCTNTIGGNSRENAQLIALAPEMAEAILAWDGPEGWKTEMFMENVAAKLRAIGAEDD